MSSDSNPLPRDLRSFGRIRGRKLRSNHSRLVDELLPKITVALPVKGEVDPHAIFPDKKEVWLEIGFGGGEHLAHLAQSHTEVGFIGCEPFLNGAAKLLSAVEQHDLTNIRVLQDDVRKLLQVMRPNSLSRVYIFHPDPWPKARHHKRRLISHEFIKLLHSRMKQGAVVKIATDWMDYANWILEHFLQSPLFKWTAEQSTDWTVRFSESCATRYEIKARAEGRAPTYLEFIAL